MSRFVSLVALCMTCPAIGSNIGNSKFTVNNVIQSHMVVQQQKEFVVWGIGPAGEKVKAHASWDGRSRTTIIGTTGEWECRIPVPDARPGQSIAHTLTIRCEDEIRVYDDILIGEVWFLSGQSNMEMTMQPAEPWHHGVENWEAEVSAANFPELRFITSDRVQSDVPLWNGTGIWQVCTSKTAGALSGVGYYFARMLLQELRIPIGLVITSHGGMSAQMYTSEQALSRAPILKAKYLQPYLDNPQKIVETNRPAKLYNGMIYPFKNLSMRGILWYQGESNAGDYRTYDLLVLNMLQDWRILFGQKELPFYYVQVTPYAWLKETDPDPSPKAFYSEEYAFFRETQSRIREETSNCHMVTTMDIGMAKMIHPPMKKPIGERLARLALAHDYGRTISCHAPRFKSFYQEGNKTIIQFDHVESGLRTNDGQAPRYFFVAGTDRKFHEADAMILGNRIELTCSEVKDPIAVRYAFLSFPITNLESLDGLPVEPFRTDEWPLGSVTYITK